MATTPSPKSPEQSDKTRRYDRQLRLWGDHGQQALESSSVCLINASAVGTEVLKSLILPGIGSYTIIDSHKVTPQDTGNNFFLGSCGSQVGRNRGEAVLAFLSELNEETHGEAIEESVESMLKSSPKFFSSFSVVIACDLPENTLVWLSETLWESNTPLIVCHSYGFIGYIRLQLKEHCVVESHPDNMHEDLRLEDPFPALKKFFDSVDLEHLDFKSHSHIPYVVILYKALKQWQALKFPYLPHIPTSYKEKNELKDIIQRGMRKNEKEGEQENHLEALRAVNTAFQPKDVSPHLDDIFQDEACRNLHTKSGDFWVMASAVKDFVNGDGHGRLPVRGTIPDMTSDSAQYIALHDIYREQAKRDCEVVYRHVQSTLKRLGRNGDSIPETHVKTFCRNAPFLQLIRGSSLSSEYSKRGPLLRNIDLASELESGDSELSLYILLRASERFLNEFGRYPGALDGLLEADIAQFKGKTTKLERVSAWHCETRRRVEYL